MVTPEEERLILKQFLRFGETRPIVELMPAQRLAAVTHGADPNGGNLTETPGMCGNSRGGSRSAGSTCCGEDKASVDATVQHSAGGPALLLPSHFPSSALHRLLPPTEVINKGAFSERHADRSPGESQDFSSVCERHRPVVFQQDPLSERPWQDRGGGERGRDLMSQQFKGEPALRIKADPDRPIKAPLTWQQGRRFTGDQELNLHRARRETSSSLSPPFNSSSYSLSPLPAFSSSFLCPPSSCFSSSLHPLPSPLCSLPPVLPAGTRKGRVCCGVCGKSFYDKGEKECRVGGSHVLMLFSECAAADAAVMLW